HHLGVGSSRAVGGNSGRPTGSLRSRRHLHLKSLRLRAVHSFSPPRPYTNLPREAVSRIIGTGGTSVSLSGSSSSGLLGCFITPHAAPRSGSTPRRPCSSPRRGGHCRCSQGRPRWRARARQPWVPPSSPAPWCETRG